jgi:hypothetical protein
MFVRNLRHSVYLLMAITVFSAPLAACALPGLAMSEEEKECCQHMADQCSSSQMEESHSCCIKTPPVTARALQPTIKFSPLPAVCLSDFAPDAGLPDVAERFAAVADIRGCSKSPPGQLSVLRI